MVNPNTAGNQSAYNTPNAKRAVEVRESDLPLHCPLPGSSLWNSHPMVYIPVKENGGEARCPYCGALYKLIADQSLPCIVSINRQQVEKFYHVIWNQHDKSAIPSVLSDNFEFRGSLGLMKQGHSGFAEYLDMVHTALGDYRCDIDELVCEDSKAFAKLTFSGTHRAEFLGRPATGQSVSWQGAALFHFSDGLVEKLWVLGDLKSLEDQLHS